MKSEELKSGCGAEFIFNGNDATCGEECKDKEESKS